MARPSPRHFPLQPVWPRPSARSPNANGSGNWEISSWRSTNGSANCGPWRNLSPRPRKKNGRSDPEGDRARSRPTVTRYLQRPPQNGVSGPGGYRDGGTVGHAPRWGDRADRVAAISTADNRPAHPSLSLWSPCLLPGVTLQVGSDGSRPS